MVAGAREDLGELFLGMESVGSGGGIDCRDSFRGFAVTGGGVALGIGSAFDRILEKAIGSAGLLGF